MANETTITIIGNLTADAELRYTQNGLAVANFTVASTPRTYDRQSNEWKDGEALFMPCSVWREMAEHVAGSLSKGARVVVVGTLTERKWEDKNGGGKRSRMELDVTEVGASLRYSTAALTRASTGQSGDAAGRRQANDEPWATTKPAAAPAAAGGDVWNTPGTFNDETPF